MWDFADIKASRKYDQVVDDLKKFPGARWFVGAKLNFAKNLLHTGMIGWLLFLEEKL